MWQNYSPQFKKNFLLAYQVMLGTLGHMQVWVADTVMVGQIGATPLAAASLAGVILHPVLLFGVGISYGITPLVAAADGEGDRERAATLLRHMFVISTVTGTLLFAGVLIIMPLLGYMDQPADVVELSLPYLGILTFSMIPFMVFQAARQFAEGLSKTRVAMVVILATNLINVILNYIFIYGKLGFPAMGLNGAGWASLIARVILAVWMVTYIYRGASFAPYKSAFSFRGYSAKFFRRILNIGVPAGIQYVFEVSAFAFAVVMMGWLGTAQLAAHQIAINLAAITYMAATGLSAAATIRVGNQWGLKDIPTLRTAAFSIYIMVILFMLTMAVVLIAGRSFFPALYINDVEVISISSQLLIIAAIFQLSDGVQVVGLGALRGLEDVKIPTLVTFISYWVIALPIGYLLVFTFRFGANGIWMGLLLGLTLTAIILTLRFNRLTKRLMHNLQK